MSKLPWFKRQNEEIPKELEDLEAADLVSAVAKAKEVDSLKTELETTKGKLSEFDAVKQRLAALEGNKQDPPKDPPKGPTSFLDDEDKAFTERLAPFAEMTLRNQAQNARHMAKQGLSGLDRRIWEKWEGEIDKIMEGVGLQFQGSAQTWLNALTNIKGRHMDEILKMKDDNSEFFSESGDSGGSGGPTKKDDGELTAEEVKIAARMGIKPEDYAKNKKAMVMHG